VRPPRSILNILEVNPLAIPRSKDLGLEPQGFADPASENVEENPKNLTAAMLTSLRSHVPKARDSLLDVAWSSSPRGPSAPTSRRFAPAAIATLGRHAARAAPQEHPDILEVYPLAIPRPKDLGLEPQGLAGLASENVEEKPKNLPAAMWTSLRSHVPKARDSLLDVAWSSSG